MDHKQGSDRNQIVMFSLESAIPKDSFVRVVDAFRRFLWLLKEWNLIESQTIAIDSFKIRARNSLKKNCNDKKLKHHLEYIDNQIRAYEEQLEKSDQEEEIKALNAKISERKEKQDYYKSISNKLKDSGEEQISVTDPDSRAVVLLRNIVNAGYNIQSSSDEK